MLVYLVQRLIDGVLYLFIDKLRATVSSSRYQVEYGNEGLETLLQEF